MYFSFLLSMLLVPWLWFTVFSFLHFPPSPCSPSFFAEFSLFLCQLGGSVCYWHSLKFLSSFSFLLSFFFFRFLHEWLPFLHLCICYGPSHVFPDSFPFPPPPTMGSHLILLSTHAFFPFNIISLPTS